MKRKGQRNASDSQPLMTEMLNRTLQTRIAKCQDNNETNIAQTTKSFRQVKIFSFIFSLFLLPGASSLDASYAVDSISSRTEVKIGVILTQITGKEKLANTLFAMEIILPAIKLAIENIENNYYPILSGVRFVIHEADSNCSSTEGPLAAIDMYWAKQADMYLGPGCAYSVAPVARYSGEWGIPVVTAGALYDRFNNKMEFKTLTRVHGGLDNVAGALINILNHFNWTRIGMLYSEYTNRLGSDECLNILRPIYQRVSKPLQYVTLEKADVPKWKGEIAEMSKGSRSE